MADDGGDVDDENNGSEEDDRQQQRQWATDGCRNQEKYPSQIRWLKSLPSTSLAHAVPWDLKCVVLTLLIVVVHLCRYRGHRKNRYRVG